MGSVLNGMDIDSFGTRLVRSGCSTVHRRVVSGLNRAGVHRGVVLIPTGLTPTKVRLSANAQRFLSDISV